MITPGASRSLLSENVTGGSGHLRDHSAIERASLLPPDQPDGKGGAPISRKKPEIWRALKLGSLRLAKFLGLFALSRSLTKHKVRILCYHGIWLGEEGFTGDSMFMSRTKFSRRLELIDRLNMPVVSLADAVAAFEGQGRLPDHCIVITIDDGWYSTYADMLPFLARRGMPATIYCDTASLQQGLPIPHVMAKYLRHLAPTVKETERLKDIFAAATNMSNSAAERLKSTKLLARELSIDISPYLQNRVFDYMTPGELREAAKAGFDIQLHTHNHTLGDHCSGMVREEIEANRCALFQLLGSDENQFCHFAYPSGEYSRRSASALKALGIASSTTLEIGLASPRTPRQMLPRFADGEQVSELELEAWLSGFMEFVRAVCLVHSSVSRRLSRSLHYAS